MKCAEYAPLISRLLDRELDASAVALVERHLAGCPACAETHRAWSGQGATLRGFFRRNAVGEAFVDRVRRHAGETGLGAAYPHRRLRLGGLRWLPVAAALLLGIALTRLARDPGPGQPRVRVAVASGELEVHDAVRRGWTRARTGSNLRPGDWLRKTASSDAEVVLGDASRVEFKSSAIARVEFVPPRHQVSLVAGAVVSSVPATSAGLDVRTPAWTVSATPAEARSAGGPGGREARFGVRLRNVVEPRVEVAADGSETIVGTVHLVGGVSVESGRIAVEGAGARHELVAGSSGFFTESRFARSEAAAQPVTVELAPASGRGSGRSVLLSSMSISGAGLQIRVHVEDLPLKRLLEWSTDTAVGSAPELAVTGDLRYPVDTPPAAVAAAVGRSLGLDVAVHDAVVVGPTAELDPAPTTLSAQPREFALKKSGDGRLSFRFKGVAAEEAFRALRREAASVPFLAGDSGWVPVDLEATDLAVRDLPGWLEARLGLRTREARQTVRVAEVRVADPPADTAEAEAEVETPSRSAEGVPVAPIRTAAPAPDVEGYATARPARLAADTPESARPLASRLWRVLDATRSEADAAGAVVRPGGSSGSSAALERRATGEQLPGVASRPGSRLLIWPVLDPQTAASGPVYYVGNPGGTSASAEWLGYGPDGHLAARVPVELPPGAVTVFRPVADLGLALPHGGHWETISPTALVGAEPPREAGPVSFAFDWERLPQSWQFDVATLEQEPWVWIINPGDQPNRVAVAIVDGEGLPVAGREVMIAPHAAWVWNLVGWVAELRITHPNARLRIETSDAPLAAGVGPGSGGAVTGTDGEWLTSALPR